MAATTTPVRHTRHRNGYTVVACCYLAMQAFATVPSPLYPQYAARDRLSPLTITLIYAAYALGTSVSLLLAGHLSDRYGRRPLMFVAIGIAATGAAVFAASTSVQALFAGRILTGLAVGITASTATAYLGELFRAHRPSGDVRALQFASAGTALGGLGIGGLVSALIAQHSGHPLRTPYLMVLLVFAACTICLLAAPETRHHKGPRPRYRPQRLALPTRGRTEFVAALGGVATQFAVFGLFVGLTGTFLKLTVQQPSPMLSGATLALVFAAGVLSVGISLARRASERRKINAAATLLLTGLVLLAVSAWTPRPSLTLFLLAGTTLGAGGALLFTTSLTAATTLAQKDAVAETLTTFFLVGYLGMSIPVIGIGIALQHASIQATLLGFTLLTTAAATASTTVLRRTTHTQPKATDPPR